MRKHIDELLAQYDFKIKRIECSRSNYHLETTSGRYVLRKVIVPLEQIHFEYEVNRYLKDKVFEPLGSLYLNKKECPYSICRDKVYVLQDYIRSEEVDFKNIEDLKHIIKLLAQFHQVARGISSEFRDIEKASIKNVYSYFEKRYIESKRLYKKVLKHNAKTRFDYIFLQGYKVYEELEELALDYIDFDFCTQMIEVAKSKKTILHNDYNYHSVVKVRQGEYCIDNLDYCNFNIQILDLAKALTKIMQKNNWDIKLLEYLIKQYDAQNNLSNREVDVLKAMLIFPEKYASICQKYLNTKRRANYSMFEVKWENMLDYQQEQLKAAKEIANYL